MTQRLSCRTSQAKRENRLVIVEHLIKQMMLLLLFGSQPLYSISGVWRTDLTVVLYERSELTSPAMQCLYIIRGSLQVSHTAGDFPCSFSFGTKAACKGSIILPHASTATQSVPFQRPREVKELSLPREAGRFSTGLMRITDRREEMCRVFIEKRQECKLSNCA